MEGQHQDPYEIELLQKLKKLEAIAPQQYDYAVTLAKENNREEFLNGITILNENVQSMPPPEGLYEEVHFRTSQPKALSAKIFENGRITFSGNWDE